MPQLFVFRAQAVEAAQRLGHKNFRTETHEDSGMWKFWYEPGESPAEGWQKRDFVNHVETAWIEKRKVGVLVVTCRLDEIEPEVMNEIIAGPFKVEPLTPSLWSKGDDPEPKKGRSSTGTPRAKSDVASPTKLVWEIADSMVGAARADVIAACVAKGVNKATASTQYYRWQRAKNSK